MAKKESTQPCIMTYKQCKNIWVMCTACLNKKENNAVRNVLNNEKYKDYFEFSGKGFMDYKSL